MSNEVRNLLIGGLARDDSSVSATLKALGGSWDIEHWHDLSDVPQSLVSGTERLLPCREHCTMGVGTHVKRHVWRSDPI